MNRMSWLLVVPLALVSALSAPSGCVEFDSYEFDPSGGGSGGTGGGTGGGGAGGMGSSSTGSGGAPGCTVDANCAENECRMGGACNAGTCEWTTEIMPGVPVGAQIYGDCKQRECDGSGDISQADSPADVYDWLNPCYVDGCEAWDAPQAATGEVCETKWGNPSGLCNSTFNCIECTADGDCGGTATCTSFGKCIPAHCTDMDQDAANGETDINCGGPCAPCTAGLKCNVRTDCEGEGQCTGSPKVCVAPTCGDSLKDGNETGVDCGGSCAVDMMDPKKCPQGQGCLVPTDCASGFSCKSGVCQP